MCLLYWAERGELYRRSVTRVKGKEGRERTAVHVVVVGFREELTLGKVIQKDCFLYSVVQRRSLPYIDITFRTTLELIDVIHVLYTGVIPW